MRCGSILGEPHGRTQFLFLSGLVEHLAAVPCSPDVYRLRGVGLGSRTTGKLGRAWVGAWVVHVGGDGDVVMMCGESGKNACVYLYIYKRGMLIAYNKILFLDTLAYFTYLCMNTTKLDSTQKIYVK